MASRFAWLGSGGRSKARVLWAHRAGAVCVGEGEPFGQKALKALTENFCLTRAPKLSL